MKRCRYTAWLAACVGLAVLLSACFGGDAGASLITTAAGTPEPVYEPAGSQGDNAFFTLEDQIAATNSAQVSLALAEAQAAGLDPQSAIAQISLTSPSEEELKSGLYGGTAENTCDPERLIKYLLDNPTQGQVWADVQGIKFADIPDFIRALEVDVLEEDTLVLNHGYDPKGHAIPIVSTLAAGTAVLVDEDGEVRTRCYCGNPILPYDAPLYEPPNCLTNFAIVYTTPNDRTRVDGVPRNVHATNQLATYDNVDWKEITWGGQVGWVRANEAQERYCKPADKLDCVAFAQITQRPGSDNYIGEVNNGYVSVVAPNIDGWSLIKFAETSGWIEANTMGADGCDYEVACISVSSGTYTRPAYAGSELFGSSQPQKVEYTGQSFIDDSGTYHQVAITYPGPTTIGYINEADISVLPDSDCEISIRCAIFDVDVPVYQESTGTATWGVLWFAEVQILNEPVNGRYQIDWGQGTGWVDVLYLQGSQCQPTVECVQAYGTGYEPLPDNNGTRALPAGPFVATFSGKVAVVNGTSYREFTSPSAGAGAVWIEASVGYATLPWADCEVEPPCSPKTEICEVECSVRRVGDGYDATVSWLNLNRQADVTFNWPAAINPVPPTAPGLVPSGYTSTGIGQLMFSDTVTVDWIDQQTGRTGSVQCQLNPCDFLEESEIDPETCIRIECMVEQGIGADGVPTDSVTANWSPAVMLDLTFDWQNLTDLILTNVAPPQTSTQSTSGAGFVDVIYQGPDGQSGVVTCPIGEDPCDVFDIEFVTADTADCCPDGTGFASQAETCCPDGSRTRAGGCCADGEIVAPTDGCIPDCGDRVYLPTSDQCCPEAQVLNNSECCPSGTQAVERECIPVVEPTVEQVEAEPTPRPQPTATPQPGPTPTPRPQATATPAPTAEPTPAEVACPNGVHENGECLRLCSPGELNIDGLCVCVAGSSLLPNAIEGCGVICPAGSFNVSPTECAQIQCPTGTQLVGADCFEIECPAGTQLEGNDCIQVEVECPDGQVRQGDVCVTPGPDCPAGYSPAEGSQCVTDFGCPSPQIEVIWDGAFSECLPASECSPRDGFTAVRNGTQCIVTTVEGLVDGCFDTDGDGEIDLCT